jgi:NAD(P)-dependent dehydrogenase (short-subunit alcohol dehydrogenase family)
VSKNQSFKFIPCDSFLMKNIKATTDEYKQHHRSLDMLVFTQGIATVQNRTETSEGIDEKLALHYYGRFAFTKLLLPLLRHAETNSKVLSVFSAGVHRSYDKCLSDPDLKNNYSLRNAANAAGMYNDIAAEMYSRQPENKNITFIHSAPGFVSTNWGTEMPVWLRLPIRFIQSIGIARTVDDSGVMLSAPLLDPSLKGGYRLIDYNRSSIGREAAKTNLHTDQAAEFIWNHSNKLVDSILSEK